MKREDLEHLTASGESLTVEFKRSTGQLRRAGETLCGMLNTGGGRVLVGVTDRGAARYGPDAPGSGCVQTCFTTRNSERSF